MSISPVRHPSRNVADNPEIDYGIISGLKSFISKNIESQTNLFNNDSIKKKKIPLIKKLEGDQLKTFNANKSFTNIVKYQKFNGYFKNEVRKK